MNIISICMRHFGKSKQSHELMLWGILESSKQSYELILWGILGSPTQSYELMLKVTISYIAENDDS